MAKCILLSIKPKYVSMILNKAKTIEVRKRFPSDYVGWVYIYCTKEDSLGRIKDTPHDRYFVDCVETPQDFEKMDSGYDGKGKVVARFWCDKVEEIIFGTTLYNDLGFFTCDLYSFDLYKQSCLTKKEMRNYLKVKPNGLSGYAIHITTKLEIFDKSKEIGEFETRHWNSKNPFERDNVYELSRAPQSYCYIEVDL